MASIKTHLTLLDGLLAYYKLDGNANDAHTNALHGTAVGVPTWPTAAGSCRLRQGLQLNGTSQYVNLGNNALFTPTTGLSAGGWVYLTGTARWQWIICKYGGDTPYSDISWGLVFDWTNNVLYAMVNTTTGDQSGFWSATKTGMSALKNSWHHLAFTYDKSVLVLYSDGYEIARLTGCSGNPNSNSINVYLGYRYNSTLLQHEYMSGYLDEFAIAAKAWTAAEVRDLYHTGYPLRYEEVIAGVGDAIPESLRQAILCGTADGRFLIPGVRPIWHAKNVGVGNTIAYKRRY